MKTDDGRHAFDFLHGSWRVHNRRLAERLRGSDDWREFPSRAEVWPILHGLGNVGTISVDDLPGIGPFEGMTVRPVRSGAPHLEHPLDLHRGARTARPPAHRSFSDGVGTFYGDDVFEGRPIAVRFEWTSEGPDRATWQQAFSPDERRSWELNGGCPNGRPCCDVLV